MQFHKTITSDHVVYLYELTGLWVLAGVAGAVVGALLNYALTSIFTWQRGT